MKAKTLAVLTTFVRCGGTGETATSLGLSATAVLKALRRGEESLGVPLMVQVSGRWRPTPEAAVLAAHAANVFDEIEKTCHEAFMAGLGLTARTRLCVTANLAHGLLADTLPTVAAEGSAAVPLEIEIGAPGPQLRVGACDMGLSFGLDEDLPGLRSQKVATGNLVAAMRHDDHLAARAIVAPAELSARSLIGPWPEEMPEHDTVRQAMIAAGLADGPSVTVPHNDLACHFARSGSGIAVIDSFTVAAGLAAGLAIRPIAGGRPITVYTHYFAETDAGPVCARLLNALIETGGGYAANAEQ